MIHPSKPRMLVPHVLLEIGDAASTLIRVRTPPTSLSLINHTLVEAKFLPSHLIVVVIVTHNINREEEVGAMMSGAGGAGGGGGGGGG
jgi:hypothetical protein